jgi:hypothetical protein
VLAVSCDEAVCSTNHRSPQAEPILSVRRKTLRKTTKRRKKKTLRKRKRKRK